MTKISCVYTGASPRMLENIEKELAKAITKPYILQHMTNPEIISRVAKANFISDIDVADLIRSYTICMDSGSHIIVNVCSSVGDIADSARSVFSKAGVEIICIDDEMCKQASLKHRKIGVMATLRSTLEPTCRRLNRHAKEAGTTIEIMELLADNTYGIEPSALSAILSQMAKENGDKLDAIILAQASMAMFEQDIAQMCDIPVYSSPRYCALALSEIINNKKEGYKR